MKANKQILAAIIILALPIFFADSVCAQGPNIMFMLDNSGSMNFAAYGEWQGDGDTVIEPYEDPSNPSNPSSITNRINNAAGCAEEYAYDSMPWTGSDSDIDLGAANIDGSDKIYAGIRFTDIAVLKHTDINRAYIQLTSYRNLSEDCNLVVTAHDSDDAPYFNIRITNNLKNRFSSAVRTTAQTNWNVPAWVQDQRDNGTRVDVTAIVQEIVNRDGWESGNAMVFLIEGTGKRDAHRNNTTNPIKSPELYIDYEPDIEDNIDFLYYGYFDSGSLDNGIYTSSRYTYNSVEERFERDPNGNWDGNWLNWCTMRRMDVLKKVLVGGKLAGATEDDAITNVCEFSTRGWYRNHDDSTGMNTPYHGNYQYEIDDGKLYVDGDIYNLNILKSPTLEPEEFDLTGTTLSGVLQDIGNRARWGSIRYDYSEGGWLDNRIANNNIDNITFDLQNRTCDGWAPLAETYYTAMQYFQREPSYYGSGRYPLNDTYDPFITNSGDELTDTESYVILLADGSPTQDINIPPEYRNTDSDSNETDRTFASDGSDYLDDIAYYAHINDLRPDLEGTQNLSLSVIYAFDDDPNARALLKDAAINGGFVDMDNDSKPDITGDARGGEWDDIGHNLEWDKNNDGDPDNYWEAANGFHLKDSLLIAISSILESADSDHDGINNLLDNCPSMCNLNQTDADSDGIGDVCDDTPGCEGCGETACEVSCDIDSDVVLNDNDNCPENCNTQQLDADEDGLGDVCDPEPGCGGCGQGPCEQEC